jgi:hypothetical protein
MNTISIEEMRARIARLNEASDFYRWFLTSDYDTYGDYVIIATAFEARRGMISVSDACKLMVGVSSWFFTTFEVDQLNAILMEVPSGEYLAIRCNLI